MASYNNSPGVVLSREQTAQLAYQAGARGEDLYFLTAVPERESSYGPGWHRTSTNDNNAASGDFGLWQINWGEWGKQLINAGIIRSHSDLYDPATNARAAVYVLQHQGRSAWNMSGDPNRGLNSPASRSAVDNAARSGLLGQDFNAGGTAAATTSGGFATSGASTGPVALPSDAVLVNVPDGGGTFAVFNVAPGVYVHYGLSGGAPAGSSAQTMSNAQYVQRFGQSVDGGNAEELKFMAGSFNTYGQWFNSILDSTIGTSNPARHDPEVLRVLTEYAARPDMERAELENKLQATQWFQTRTEGQLEWNDLSEAERVKRREDTRSQMASQFQQFVGEAHGATHYTVNNYLEQVASGAMGFGAWTESVLKPYAGSYTETPYSRDIRTEQEAGRQRGIDIENTTARIRDELERYGLQWDAATLTNFAKGMVEKHYSDDYLTQTLEYQAQVMYPGLGPLNGADVATLAAPWLETYERVLERKGSLFTPEIRQALAQGTPVWDMEVGLTKSPKWLETRNADERMHSLAGQVGELMGY